MRYMLNILAIATGLAVSSAAMAAASAKPLATVFKNPQCGCCETYGEYLRKNGYEVKVVATHDLPLIQQRQGVPAGLEGCHTTLIGGYFVDGHVPVENLDQLLAERPEINGITLPGMPMGSPGMGGPKTEPFTIYAVGKDGAKSVYAVD